MPYERSATAGDGEASPLVRAAERLMNRIEAMEGELARLRAENATLRADVRSAVALFNRSSPAAVADGGRRRKATTAPPRRRRRKAAKGRATPSSVTPAVVMAVIGKLGPATASEIAKEISAAGTPVSGRAVRFLAERGGAASVLGEDGKRRYRG